ncbi:MAG: hypothetical protein NWF07_04705 [Candidatus Bathyarchaeota archaeon]|nr:hypothetical protein [Candidatus Bathyarchaeota archaeon]
MKKMVTKMEDNTSPYREDRNSIFLKTFGKSPQTRIIDLFLDNPFFEFTRLEMIEALGMAKVTMYNTIPLIVQSGIITPSRKIGRSQLYRLNGDSPIVKNLRNIIKEASFEVAELEILDSEIEDSTSNISKEKTSVVTQDE